jgi:hypothetical protein
MIGPESQPVASYPPSNVDASALPKARCRCRDRRRAKVDSFTRSTRSEGRLVQLRASLAPRWQAGYIEASSRPVKYIIWGDKPPRRAIQFRTCCGYTVIKS